MYTVEDAPFHTLWKYDHSNKLKSHDIKKIEKNEKNCEIKIFATVFTLRKHKRAVKKAAQAAAGRNVT